MGQLGPNEDWWLKLQAYNEERCEQLYTGLAGCVSTLACPHNYWL
jgi:hypothetical protein